MLNLFNNYSARGRWISLLRSRSDRSHATRGDGERCVTPARAAAIVRIESLRSEAESSAGKKQIFNVSI